MNGRIARGRMVGLLVGATVAGGCEPAEDVQVLPLPPLERLTPEARYGIPEVKGIWRFAGWEVEPGDSALLERSYPEFGSLDLRAQRLDSIAGALALQGGEAPIVGEVRRDGWFSLATLSGAGATAYFAGRYARDTLWLEMTSLVAVTDWPAGAKGVFVREGDGVPGPIAWFRGASPFAPAALPDSLAAAATATDSLASAPVAGGAGASVPGQEGGEAAPARGAGDGAMAREPVANTSAAATSATNQPAHPAPPAIPRPAPPPRRPVREEPVPAVPERREGPRLLGEPVTPR